MTALQEMHSWANEQFQLNKKAKQFIDTRPEAQFYDYERKVEHDNPPNINNSRNIPTLSLFDEQTGRFKSQRQISELLLEKDIDVSKPTISLGNDLLFEGPLAMKLCLEMVGGDPQKHLLFGALWDDFTSLPMPHFKKMLNERSSINEHF
mmetsp:Transcript_16045/g.27056  ORF Transcript_16045/g.27056 Transcript_16045/m.27056 type:complete len:150 (-) Transcript_16045:285-734(-)